MSDLVDVRRAAEPPPADLVKKSESLLVGLRGELLRPGDEEYDRARRIHNGMIDHGPALIARCREAADVVQAVNFARQHKLLVSVMGGGHGVSGFAVCDGGLMIGLSGMKNFRVDPARRTARAEAGATWGDFDRATQSFGLATTGGVERTTGIAGLTLAGGDGSLHGLRVKGVHIRLHRHALYRARRRPLHVPS